MSGAGIGLVGRGREVSRLISLVTEVAARRGSVVLVEGEPGIGKTALVRAVSAAAVDHGCRAYWGAGDELGQRLPLLPLLEAFQVGRTVDDHDILPLLRGEIHVGGDPSAAAAERMLGLVDELCGRGPTVLVIDDLQWADRVTVAVWSRLAKMVDQLPLLLIGTMRTVPVREDLAALRGHSGITDRLKLGPLSPAEVGDLVEMLTGGDQTPELLKLAEGAAGNALYITELVGALASGATPPGSLAGAIESRLGFLSDEVRHVLRAATLLGVVFSIADLGAVLGRRICDLLSALDQARVAGVLTDTDDGMSFRHPLVRTALYEGMPSAVRAAWHFDAARALAETGAGVERVARQLLVAADGDDWVVDWLFANSDVLVGQAPAAAVDLLRRVLLNFGDDARVTVLACGLADALYRIGEVAEAEQVATRTANTVADPELLVRAHCTLIQCRLMTGRSAQSLVELGNALKSPAVSGRARARLLALTARTHWNLGELDAADHAATNALAEADGDAWTIGWALHVRTITCIESGRMRDALPLLDEALNVVRTDTATADLRLLLLVNRAVVLGELDRLDLAIAAGHDAQQQAERVGNTVRLAQAQSALGQLLYDAGRWDDMLVEVGLLPDDLKHPETSCCDHGVAALVHLHRGDPVAARRHLNDSGSFAQLLGDRVVIQLSLATSLEHERAGDLDKALATLLPGSADDVLPEIVRLAVEVGDRDAASEATETVEGLAADSEVPHRIAAAAYCRGLVDGDAEELLRAAKSYREAGRPLPRAKALEAAAVAFVADGQMSSARAAATRSLELYAELGADWQLARAQSRLRACGIRRGPRVKHRRATVGWDSLTPAEATVASLVVEGMSNPQIAERLFVSRRTVATHVSHILAKLQVRTRTDIAREASLRQLASG